MPDQSPRPLPFPQLQTRGPGSDQASEADRPARPDHPTSNEPPSSARGPTDLPRRNGSLSVWLLLLACLAIACPALLVEIDKPDVTQRAEARSLATSIQTWQRQITVDDATAGGLGAERMLPYRNEKKQLRDPPGLAWSHLAALAVFDTPAGAELRQLILRARITSIIFALLTIAAVYWAGHSIGGISTAAVSALICAANPVFIYYGRLATADTQHAALTMVAVAAALWAIRPMRPAPSVERQFIGWVTSGLALGAAILTGGPWTILHVALPVLLLLVLCPGRLSHLLGLLAALLIGTLMVIPWAVYADQHDATAYLHWLATIRPSDEGVLGRLAGQASWRALLLVAAMLPWTLWIVGAVIQPFSASSAGTRLRMLLGWVWFAAALLLVLFNPRQVQPADPLIMMPAAAILIGHLFTQFSSLASEGRHARIWRLLRWPHLAILIVVSTAVPAAMYLQAPLQNLGWLPQTLVKAPPWYYGPCLAVALLSIVFLSLRWAQRQFPIRAVVCWAVWTLALIAVVAIPLARGPAMVSNVDDRIEAQVRDKAVYWLDPEPRKGAEPDPILMLYANRVVRTVGPQEIGQLQEAPEPFVLVAPITDEQLTHEMVELERLPILGVSFWTYNAPAEPDQPLEQAPASGAPAAPGEQGPGAGDPLGAGGEGR